MNLLAQIGMGAALLAGAAAVWQWDRHRQFEAGRAALAAELKAADERDAADRKERVAIAARNQSERDRAQRSRDAIRQAAAVAAAAAAASVRDDLRAIEAGPATVAAGACGERTARLEGLLRAGAGLFAEGLDLAVEGEGLVNGGASRAERGESLIQLCVEFDASVRLADLPATSASQPTR